MKTPLILALVVPLACLSAQDLPLRLPPSATPAGSSASPTTDAAMRDAMDQLRIDGATMTSVRFDQPRADGPLWALGRAWKASFDATGCTVIPFFGSSAPRDFPLHLQLAQATVGGQPLNLVGSEPVRHGTTVRTVHGDVTELVATQLDSLEQSFVFDRLPNRGAITVDLHVDSELVPSAIEGGLRFANDYGHVDYTKAVAVDAAGQRQPLDIVWTGEGARMEIPAAFVAKAQLPIVLDPVLNYWFLLASGQTQLQHDSDVASFQALGGRTLMIWQRQWSASDQDVWGLMFDGNLGLVQTDFSLDFTSEDWTKIAVAANNYAQNFLVVGEVRIGVFLGSQYDIRGRGIASDATVGAEFDIERNGVVGLGGDNFHPDVGSDPYYGVGRYTVVFNKHLGGASDIYMKQVTTAGSLVTTNPIAIDTSTSEESNPSISKSCGQSNGLPAYWLVTYQRTYSGSDQDLYGRYINWNGALPGGVFAMATSGGNETAPSACSPFDQNGVRYWTVAYEYATSPGQPRDIICRLFRNDGGYQAGFTASNNVPGADDRDPEIDSDGTRFVVGLTTGTTGYPQSPQAVTIGYSASTNSFSVNERTGLLTSSLDDYGECNVVADYSGGNAISPRYFFTFSAHATNTFELMNFGGYVGGNFFSPRATQCGNATMQVTGSPVLGQSVTATVFGAATGTILGFPGYIPLNALGCNCYLGVDQGIFLGSPLVWNVPNDPTYVGITLSVQGWSLGNQCLGFLDLSDTVDFTIR